MSSFDSFSFQSLLRRKPLLYGAGGLVVLLLAVLGYRWFQNGQVPPAWRAVPASAVAVWEIDNPLDALDGARTEAAWQPLAALPYVQTLLARLDSLRMHPETRRLLGRKKVLLALHATTRHEFDWLVCVSLQDADPALVGRLLAAYRSRPEYRTDTRTFGGRRITEITHRPSRQVFSFVIQDGVLVGSYTSFLVEDAIRQLDAQSDAAAWPRWQADRLRQEGPVRLLVHLAGVPRLAQALTGNAAEAGLFGQAGRFATLSQETGRNGMTWRGRVQAEAGQYLAVFDGQQPRPAGCLGLVPAQTAVLQRWSFSDAAAFFKRQHAYDSLHGHAPAWRPDPRWIGTEMALATVETTGEQPDRLLLVHTVHFSRALRQLQAVAAGTVTEKYAGATVYSLDVPEFPARFFAASLTGFPRCYYALVGQYMVFGNSIQALRNLLDSHATGAVWSQSERHRKAVAVLAPACFSLHAHIGHAWASVLRQAVPQWRRLLNQHSDPLKEFEWVSLGVGSLKKGSAAAELRLQIRPQTAAAVQNRFFTVWKATADTTLTLPPVLVRNHLDRSRELITQDAAHRLYLVNQAGKVLWRKWLDGPVQSAVQQVDYLKNNKLQYLLATRTHLHLIDRNGSPVPPYPVRVPTAAGLHTLAVADYDGTLDYRFLVSDMLGNLYLYDKAGTLLEGWNPLRIGYRLQCAPRHIRLRDKDYFVVLLANGRLTLLNRRGQAYPGFPLDLKARTESPFLIQEGSTPDDTQVVVVTRDGEVIRVNLAGRITERQQLYRLSAGSTYRLCAEPQGRDWTVARTDSRTLALLDKTGRLLWETASPGAADNTVQYYNFGSGLRLAALTDLADGQSSVYDLATGRQVGGGPFANRLPLAAVYVDAYGKLLLHYTHGRQAGLLSIKVK